ncbi:MAG TPA: acetyl-CoA C-acyltransferase [Chloroflexaceae bacterium]|nr:acetyl-CoA C-acyltransferase [Chloroflexaceae bacterium]
MNDVYIAAALRTPVGRYGGALAGARPDDLAADLIRALVGRTGIDPAAVADVYLGATNQAGEDNRDVARMAALLAGLPVSVPGVTVNRLCGSGLEAVNQAARAAALGEGELYIAGGVESMTRAPFVFGKSEGAYERTPPQVYDTTIGWRFTNPRMAAMGHTMALGVTAELVAERYGVAREDQDAFALESQRRAAAAQASGRFADEIVPVRITAARKGQPPALFEADEHPRPDTTLEALAKLRPAFKEGGTVTAGNSSGVNDGAAALLLATAPALQRHGLRPLARVVSMAVAGVEPAVMGLGPIPATRRALARAGLRAGDLDLVELNEAFASQALACLRELELDPARVNVNGGAIALGHPLGASGARLLTTLAHELRRRGGRYGLATMCIGVGQGIATVIEAA